MGESDKMSSDSVTNRECRAVPTPNVILLYDEHRDAVADAFVRYSRPYDTVRCPFADGRPVFPESKLLDLSHIQIAVRRQEALVDIFAVETSDL